MIYTELIVLFEAPIPLDSSLRQLFLSHLESKQLILITVQQVGEASVTVASRWSDAIKLFLVQSISICPNVRT